MMNKRFHTLIFMLVLTALASCASLQPKAVSFEYLPALYQGGAADDLAPGFFVVNSPSELEVIVQKYQFQQGSSEIDLAYLLQNRTLLFVHGGLVPTSGHEVQIVEIKTSKRRIELSLRLQKPGKNCLVANAHEIPLQMVLIDKWSGNKQALQIVTFEKDCR
jgi:hypothetical protein